MAALVARLEAAATLLAADKVSLCVCLCVFESIFQDCATCLSR